MEQILVEKALSPGKMEVLGVEVWPVKTLGPGKYTEDYKASAEYYISAGAAILAYGSQPEETIGGGDLVFIPQGLTVTWKIIDEIEYHQKPKNPGAVTGSP